MFVYQGVHTHTEYRVVYVSTGDYITVYHNYFELAKYFQVTSELDKWLSDYFFDMALDTTRFIKSDDNRLAAEANCNVGLALKESRLYYIVIVHSSAFVDHFGTCF